MSANLQFSEEERSGTAMEVLNVILFGKTGSGKSSLGNTLLKGNKFKVQAGMNSGTAESNWKEATLDRVQLKVTDVPGLFDTEFSEEYIEKETAKSVALVEPGPHAILFVIPASRRFTKEERDAYLKAKELFTPSIRDFMIVVFTSVDSLTNKGNRVDSLKDAVQNAPHSVKEIIKEVNDRYIGVENTASEEDKNQQRKDIIKMIQELRAKNNGQHYIVSKEVNQMVEEVIEKRAVDNGCNKEVAAQVVKEEIVDNKQTELVNNIEKKAKKEGWGCTIL